ncbi:hypothetical protein [Dactylosporangium sp. CA-233914]|uniref:hypothetical protein n=1 Tax=Dactylosporangium sp. CA-233914 TaxID=3239934 RepID=UPI003D8C47B9
MPGVPVSPPVPLSARSRLSMPVPPPWAALTRVGNLYVAAKSVDGGIAVQTASTLEGIAAAPKRQVWKPDVPHQLVFLTGHLTGISHSAAVWEQRHNDAQRIGAMAAQTYLTVFPARNATGNRLHWE